MAGNRPPGDDAVLRRLRYAAAIVFIGSLALIVGSYVIAYATRADARPPDGPLVVILVASMLVLLGILSADSSVFASVFGRRGKGDDDAR